MTRLGWALLALCWLIMIVWLWQSAGCSVETPC